MVTPTKMKLDEPTLFLEPTEFFDEETMEEWLSEHLHKRGFKIAAYNVDRHSEEDFAKLRANSFGASDSAVLLGVAFSSKRVDMKTQDDLLIEKINEDWDESIAKKAAVRKGTELEPLLIEKISKLIDGVVIKPKHMYMSTHGDGLATNFDGVVFEAEKNNGEITDTFEPIPMEIKVCSFFGRRNYNWDKGLSEFENNVKQKLVSPREYPFVGDADVTKHIERISDIIGIPKYYYPQVQQQMHFLNSTHGYLAVMDDIDWTLYFYKFPRDQFVIDEIKKQATEMYKVLKEKKDE